MVSIFAAVEDAGVSDWREFATEIHRLSSGRLHGKCAIDMFCKDSCPADVREIGSDEAGCLIRGDVRGGPQLKPESRFVPNLGLRFGL